MKINNSFFYTLREDVKDEDSVSSNLLVRGGFIKKNSAGVYMMLPMGWRVMRKIEAIIRDEKSILPGSSMMHGEYGIDGVTLSMPAVVGKNGVEKLVPIELSKTEQKKLRASADTLRGVLAEVMN